MHSRILSEPGMTSPIAIHDYVHYPVKMVFTSNDNTLHKVFLVESYLFQNYR
jgi:hypothetical protein